MLSKPRSTLSLLLALAILAGAAITFIETLSLEPGLWGAYAFLILLGEGLLYLAWKLVERDGAGKQLFTLVLVGLFLRIGVGVALYQGLPRWGYDEKAQRAGYVYWDAYKRDTDAYARARSDLPLITAFTTPKPSDQYGGVLFLSSLIYRHIRLPEHHPLLVTTLFASISLLGVLFTWGFLKRAFDEKIAWVGALVVLLYPEAILLSASQMREPFLMSAVAMALYGYSSMRSGQMRAGSLLCGFAVGVLTFPISPPTVPILLLLLVAAWAWERRDRRRVIAAIGLAAFIIAGIAMMVSAKAWASLEGVDGSLLEVTQSWLANTTAPWRITLVSGQSDILDVILDRLPGALQVPFLVTFGLLQPLLPAAIIAPGASIWRIVGILRSLGWAISLPVLFYATIKGMRKQSRHTLILYFVILFWAAAALSSVRAPSYQWDNPRYRATFIAVQAGLMAWGWMIAGRSRDPWLKRAFILFAIPAIVVTAWYYGRYSGAFSMSFELTAISSVVLVGVSLAGMSLLDFRNRRASVGIKPDK
jgi:hypothetical protein